MTPVTLSSFANRLLMGIVFLFIPLSLMAPHSVVWEIIIGGLVGLYYSQKQPLTKLSKPLVYTLLAIPLWAMVTVLWAEYPKSAFIMSLKILALIILGLYWCRLTLSLPEDTQKSLIKALMGGLFLGIFFLTLDSWCGNPWQTFWKKSPSKAFAQGSLLISLATWPAILCILQSPRSLQWRCSVKPLDYCVSKKISQN